MTDNEYMTNTAAPARNPFVSTSPRPTEYDKSTPVVIGTMFVAAGSRCRQDKQNASWWDQIVWDDQTVTLTLRGGYVNYGVACTIVQEFYGRQIEDVEKPATDCRSPYDYSVATAIGEGGNPDGIDLAQGVTVKWHTMNHPVSCSGYETDYSVAIGSGGNRYPDCDCPHHLDGAGRIKEDRKANGKLQFGYKPFEVKTVTHWSFTPGEHQLGDADQMALF